MSESHELALSLIGGQDIHSLKLKWWGQSITNDNLKKKRAAQRSR